MNDKSAEVNKTKKEIVVELLRETILSGELVPGERLLQEELAERFDVSATPIREAIQQLVAEGVLSHSPYKGVQVAEVRADDVREVYLIRSVIEELSTLIAVPNLRIADVKQLHALQQEIEQHVQSGDLQPLRRLNYEFHMLIYKTAEMPLLFQMIRNLWTKFPWDTLHVLPNRAQNSLQEHQLILDAIDKGDPDLASQHMRKHIENGSAALTDYLSSKK